MIRAQSVYSVGGYSLNFASPGPIGGSTPDAGTFTAITGTSLSVPPSSGTISYASNWSASTGSVVKKCNDLVVLNFGCAGAGSGSGTVATLPAGYRPITASLICVGRYYYADGPSYSMVQVTIATSGTITINFVVPSTASGDLLQLNVSYYVV